MIQMVPAILIHLWIMLHSPAHDVYETINVKSSTYQSVLQATREEHEVITDFVCINDMDIECVDDVCNDRGNHLFWTISINGDYVGCNSRTVVSPKDRIKLEYASLERK